MPTTLGDRTWASSAVPATTLMVAGTAFGPLLFALGFEQFGRYAPTLTLALLAPLAVGIVAL